MHPWIFKGDVADASPVEPGSVVTVLDAGGRFVGRGLFNPRPALCCRIVTWQDEPVDARLLGRRVAAAIAARGKTVPVVGRLVWSEADGLPGLVVDRYGPVLVVQCLTLGMPAAARRPRRARSATGSGISRCSAATTPSWPAWRASSRCPAGSGRPGPDEVVVDEDGVRIAVRPGSGHKTGVYLDQAANRVRVGAAAGAGDVLDVFAYTAGFAVHALRAGARRAVCVESSAEAIAGARRNLELNGLSERAEIRAVNAFDELRRLDRERARFDLVVLDPPPFARSRTALDGRPARLQGDQPARPAAARSRRPPGDLLLLPPRGRGHLRGDRAARRPPTPASGCASSTACPSPPTTRSCSPSPRPDTCRACSSSWREWPGATPLPAAGLAVLQDPHALGV